MSDPAQETTRKFGRLLAAVGALGEDLHGQGVIDLEQVRWSLATRQTEGARRVANGESIRKVAREAGVDESTLRKNLGRKGAEKSAKNAEKSAIGHDLDGCGTSYDEDEETLWRNNLASMAVYANGLLSHWERRFSNWRRIKATIKDVELAEGAAQSWKDIATTLKRNME